MLAKAGPIVLILGSGPNVTQARDWPKAWFDIIVVINNAWQVRPDWDALVYPEDFPACNLPPSLSATQQLVAADAFVPAQNRYGGFVHAGATMAYTSAYWALAALRPRVMAFMGCDMVYPAQGSTHFYGSGTADPLRDDVSLRDLGAKSARLAVLSAEQGCACVNLSQNESSLLFARASPDALRGDRVMPDAPASGVADLRAQEDTLGYGTPDGRYVNDPAAYDTVGLAQIDLAWRNLLKNGH